MKTVFVIGAAALLSTTGCALLSKSEPFTPRFFSVEPPEVPAGVGEGASAQSSARPELRLGRVTSASYLGERIVFRKSQAELGFYEDRRWSERPESYFRRALVRQLYEGGRFVHVVSGVAPQLDVDLVEFAELKAPSHVARVRASYALFEARYVRAEGSVTAEVPVDAAKGDDAEAAAVVSAMSRALNGAVEQIVARVTAGYAAKAAPEPTASRAP